MGDSVAAPVLQANGASMPAFGLGTWRLRDAGASDMVRAALQLGVRHVDTARMYDNERAVGAGVRAAGVPREQIFVTTKLPPGAWDAAAATRSAEDSLRDLGIGYIDLLLIHWPSRDVPLAETLGAMAALRRRGLVRHLGVSNFNVALLEQAVAQCSEPIVNNQVEYHPYLDQSRLLAACRRLGVALTAYSPLVQGKVNGEPAILEVARELGRSAAQVTLRWLVQQHGVAVIPRSSDVDHLRANFAIFDFELSAAQCARLSALAHAGGRRVDPDQWAPDWNA